jgi:hypothetical protein
VSERIDRDKIVRCKQEKEKPKRNKLKEYKRKKANKINHK